MEKMKYYLIAMMGIVFFVLGCTNSEDIQEVPAYTVTFDSQEGSVVELQIIQEGDKAVEPDAPAKEDHLFEGWYKEPTFENKWDFDTDVVTENITLYASWIPDRVYTNCYFVATDGDDSNPGTISQPFATINKAYSEVQPGDTIYIRKGTYTIKESQMMNPNPNTTWSYVFDFSDASHTGTSSKRICIWGFRNERPVFDLSQVKPADKRVIVFYVNKHYYHFKNFEITGTQVTILDHTQSECFRNDGGNGNIYENLSMHDGKAIGFYLVRGQNNLVLNCDAYNNWDDISEGGSGGNVDGFGGHPNATGTGNVFRGCRAWWNSDDGFDLINAHSAYTIDNCWSFYNGYRPGTLTSAGDGAGFKSGGYGMSENPSVPAVIPRHVVTGCLAYYNKNQGFYANHHLGGITFYNNTGYKNPSNFNMVNRKSASETIDVSGYGHIIKNNLSFEPRLADNHIINVNSSECEISNNSFLPSMAISSADFMSLDEEQLMQPRKADGSLPDIDFLKPKTGSSLINAGADVGTGNTNIGCF